MLELRYFRNKHDDSQKMVLIFAHKTVHYILHKLSDNELYPISLQFFHNTAAVYHPNQSETCLYWKESVSDIFYKQNL